jgi:hypothetical protein
MYGPASDGRKGLLCGLVKHIAFTCSEQFQLAASRCCGYADLKDYRSILRKNLQRLTFYPVVGLLDANGRLAADCLEARGYML